MKVDWSIKDDCDTYDTAVKRFSRFLENQGCRPNTIKSYAQYIKGYIKFCQTPEPNNEKLEEFRDQLFDRHLARSTINNYAFAIMQYHRMIGEPVKLPLLKSLKKGRIDIWQSFQARFTLLLPYPAVLTDSL